MEREKALLQRRLRFAHHLAHYLSGRFDGIDKSRALPARHPAFFDLALVARLLCQRETVLDRLNRERLDFRLASDPRFVNLLRMSLQGLPEWQRVMVVPSSSISTILFL